MASLAHKIFASLKSGDLPTSAMPETRSDKSVASPLSPTTASSPTSAWNERFYHVAVQGCSHGELDRIYDACAAHERQTGKRIDVLICCGDFQAVRTALDMDSMAMPDKFKVMGDFHKYWNPEGSSTAGLTTAPYLTIFVGGNHENSDLLAQESYGGFVAPNIYYLGHSGVVTVDKCLRVAGLSGIFKDQDYDRPYPPRPYAANYGWKKSAYHVRHIEVAKLDAYLRAAQALQQPTEVDKESATPPLVDIFVSHDWPVGITAYGDEAQLLRHKPYFRDDIQRHTLGNPHTLNLLRAAKPVYWVAAHLHCYFEATVSHNATRFSTDGKSGTTATVAPTKFVALDKCAKGTGFLTFLDLPRRSRSSAATVAADNARQVDSHGTVDSAMRIERDPLWLEVLAASHPFVAENCTTETGASQHSTRLFQSVDRCFFDTDETARSLVARHTSTLSESYLPVTAASKAATTAALLRELHLSPALPLQHQPQEVSSSTRSSAATVRYEQTCRPASQWVAPQAHDSAASDMQRVHQRPRTEVSTVLVAPATPVNSAVAAAAATAAAPPSFLEEVERASSPLAAAALPLSPSTATNTNITPAPLAWFEDTTQQD